MELTLTKVRDDGRQKLDIKITCAHTWFRRLKGLLATLSLPDNRGLWLKPCKSIHTLGMFYTIDVVFLDAHGRIVKLAPRVFPMWFSLAPSKVKSVLELNAGNIGRLDLRVGDQLEFLNIE